MRRFLLLSALACLALAMSGCLYADKRGSDHSSSAPSTSSGNRYPSTGPSAPRHTSGCDSSSYSRTESVSDYTETRREERTESVTTTPRTTTAPPRPGRHPSGN